MPFQEEKKVFFPGVFLSGYAVLRFVAEFFREPDEQLGFLFGGATMGQLLSLPVLLFGAFLIVRSRRFKA